MRNYFCLKLFDQSTQFQTGVVRSSGYHGYSFCSADKIVVLRKNRNPIQVFGSWKDGLCCHSGKAE